MIRRPTCRDSETPAPRRAVRVLRALLAVAGAVAAASAGCQPPPPSHGAVGRAVGELPIVSIADATLPAPTVAGRVTLLNFWGTWCPPCRRELPGLVRLAARLADDPAFQLVAVSCGAGAEDLDEISGETRAFLRDRDLALTAWAFADPDARRAVSARLGLDAFPTTYLVGPDGRVRHVWRGYRPGDEPDIARAVLEMLKERLRDHAREHAWDHQRERAGRRATAMRRHDGRGLVLTRPRVGRETRGPRRPDRVRP